MTEICGRMAWNILDVHDRLLEIVRQRMSDAHFAVILRQISLTDVDAKLRWRYD